MTSLLSQVGVVVVAAGLGVGVGEHLGGYNDDSEHNGIANSPALLEMA